MSEEVHFFEDRRQALPRWNPRSATSCPAYIWHRVLLGIGTCGHDNGARADLYHSSGVNEQWMRDLAHLSAAGPQPHPLSEPEGSTTGERRRELIDAGTEESSSPGAGGARLSARGYQAAADAMHLPSPSRLHRRRRAASHEARDRWLGVCPEPE